MSMQIELIPTASAVSAAVSAAVMADAAAVEVVVVDVDTLIQQVKQLETSDLFKVIKVAVAEAERKSKGVKSAAPKAPKEKKQGSMPKGVVPLQLRENRGWVAFTLKHALENGWESFTVNQTKKDKVTGEKVKEEIEMAASVMVDGAHVFGDSVTEKKPNGVQLNHKHAMSLSSQRWTKKTQTGTHEELYDEFLAQYDAEAVEEEVKEEKPAKVAVVRKTAAEKEAEMQKKKEEREAAAKQKKEAREEVAKQKKEAREAEKKKKEEKPVKAAAAPKAAVVKAAAVKEPVKAAAVVKEPAKAAAKAVTPVKVAAPVKAPAAPQKKKAEEVWACEDDGCVAPWSYKGKKYMRDFGNNVWLNTNNLPGDWCGVYIPSEDRIDDSQEEPVLEDE